MNLKTLLTFLMAMLLLLGCQEQPTTPQVAIENTQSSSALQQKVALGFQQAQELQEKHSQWSHKDERLPLTIIATAYIDPEVTQTKEYKIYNNLLKQIEKDPTILDKLSGSKLSSQYSSIKYIDYNLNSNAKEKFNAAYVNQNADKDKLTDILRPDVERPSQELLIRLNLKELKKGNLSIEGYKTVKQTNKQRNSSYYTLKRIDYKQLNAKEKKLAIADSIIATLQLSIPEYVSIDRKELVKDGEVLRFITPQEDGSYTGEVWKYQIDNRTAKVEKELEQLYTNSQAFGTTLKVLKGHTEEVNSVAISPDGKYALSGGGDYYGGKDFSLRYWNLKTGKTVKVLKGHTGDVKAVAISPDGNYALSGSDDDTLRYWNLKTGETVKVLKGHTGHVDSVAISPDGKYALSGSWDDTLRYWHLKTGEIVKVLKGHTEQVKSVAISPDGKYALSGSWDKTLRYWNLKTGKTLKVLEGHTEQVKSVAISPDGKYALSGGYDKTLRYWNLKTGETLKVLKGHSSSVSSATISPDGRYALSGSDDATLRYWNLKTGETVKVLEGHRKQVTSVAISPDGKYALSGGLDNTLRYSRLSLSNKEKQKEEQLVEQLETIKASKSYISRETKQKLITLPLSETDLNTLQKTHYVKSSTELHIKEISDIAASLNYDYDNPIVTLIFSNIYNNYTNSNLEFIDKIMLMKKRDEYNLDELYFSTNLSLKDAGYVELKEIRNIDSELKEPKVLKGHTNDVYSVAISPDGKYALSGGYDKTLRYWNLKTGKTIKVLKGHTGDVNSVAISPDGKYALSGGYDKTLRYWNLQTGKTVKVFRGHTEEVRSVAINPDGKYALSGGGNYDGINFSLRYWNLKTGETVKVLEGHRKQVNSVAISPDGKYALSGSSDETLRYWNLKTGKTIKVLKGHTVSVYSVAISPDGKYALSGSWDKTLRYWNLKTGETVKVLEGHRKQVTSVAISPDGKYALSGGYDKTLRYWDLQTGKTVKVLKGHTENVSSVAISPNGNYALSGSRDKTLRYWNLAFATMNGNY